MLDPIQKACDHFVFPHVYQTEMLLDAVDKLWLWDFIDHDRFLVTATFLANSEHKMFSLKVCISGTLMLYRFLYFWSDISLRVYSSSAWIAGLSRGPFEWMCFDKSSSCAAAQLRFWLCLLLGKWEFPSTRIQSWTLSVDFWVAWWYIEMPWVNVFSDKYFGLSQSWCTGVH